MMHLIAQVSENEPSTLVSILVAGSLIAFPILIVLLAVAFFRQMNMTRIHIIRAETHWGRVETLLAQIVENTKGKSA